VHCVPALHSLHAVHAVSMHCVHALHAGSFVQSVHYVQASHAVYSV